MMKLGWNLVVVVEGRHETETGYAIYLRKNQEQKNKALHPALNQTNFFFFLFLSLSLSLSFYIVCAVIFMY